MRLVGLDDGEPGHGGVVAVVGERHRAGMTAAEMLAAPCPSNQRAAAEVRRQHVAVEHAARPAKRFPGRSGRDHQRFDLRRQRRRVMRRDGLLQQLEPVEAVGRERDHVGLFADRRKLRAAQHFQRDAAAPGGKVRVRPPAPNATGWRRTGSPRRHTGGCRRAPRGCFGRTNIIVPRPKACVDLRTAISRLVQLSSEEMLRDCASTFTAS